MSALRVSVAGATGYLGSRVVTALCARGSAVTAIARSDADTPVLRRLVSLGAAIVVIDAARGGLYEGALIGADVAVSCMASRNTGNDPADDFWSIDRDATTRFALAALTSGVGHVVLLATFEGPASRGISEFSDAKEQAVDAIRLACAAAGAALTVVRPTAYFSDLTDRAFDAVARGRRYTEIGDGSHRINPVDGDAVADLIARDIEAPPVGLREIPIGGPDVLTYRDIGCLAAESLGRLPQLRFRRMPVTLLRVLAGLAGAAGRLSRRRRRSAAILHWMVYVATHDAVAPSAGGRHLRDVFAAKRIAMDAPPP